MYQDKQAVHGYTNVGGFIGGAALGGPSQYVGESPRKPEVEAEINRLADAVDKLANVAESLCNRLEPIRSKTGAGTAGNQTSVPQPVQCALASMIRDRREAVERYTNQLQVAKSELEI